MPRMDEHDCRLYEYGAVRVSLSTCTRKSGPAKKLTPDSESAGSTSREIVEAQPFLKRDKQVISEKRSKTSLFRTLFQTTRNS
jgi:hypothetical protein